MRVSKSIIRALLPGVTILLALSTSVSISRACRLPASQTAAKSDDVYLWRYQFLKGELVQVKTQIHIECRIFDRTMASDIDQVSIDRTESVNARGDAGILETMNASKSTFGGVEVTDDIKNHTPLLVTVTKGGFVVHDTAHGATDPASLRIGALWQMVQERPAPEAAVRVGDSWSMDVPNGLVKGEKTGIVSTLVGPEKVSGVDTLKVRVHMEIHPDAAAEDKDEVRLDGYYNVDPLAGKLVHSEVTLSNVTAHGPDTDGVMRIVIKQDLAPINRLSGSNGAN